MASPGSMARQATSSRLSFTPRWTLGSRRTIPSRSSARKAGPGSDAPKAVRMVPVSAQPPPAISSSTSFRAGSDSPAAP